MRTWKEHFIDALPVHLVIFPIVLLITVLTPVGWALPIGYLLGVPLGTTGAYHIEKRMHEADG